MQTRAVDCEGSRVVTVVVNCLTAETRYDTLRLEASADMETWTPVRGGQIEWSQQRGSLALRNVALPKGMRYVRVLPFGDAPTGVMFASVIPS